MIVLQYGGDISAYYVDSTGFIEIDSFLREESYREEEKRMIERSSAAISSVDKTTPTVAELEAEVNEGKPISITDLSRAVKEERKPPTTTIKPAVNKKPSLTEQLRENKKIAAQKRQGNDISNRKEREHE